MNRKALVLLLLLVGCGAAFWWWWQQSQAQAKMAKPLVLDGEYTGLTAVAIDVGEKIYELGQGTLENALHASNAATSMVAEASSVITNPVSSVTGGIINTVSGVASTVGSTVSGWAPWNW